MPPSEQALAERKEEETSYLRNAAALVANVASLVRRRILVAFRVHAPDYERELKCDSGFGRCSCVCQLWTG